MPIISSEFIAKALEDLKKASDAAEYEWASQEYAPADICIKLMDNVKYFIDVAEGRRFPKSEVERMAKELKERNLA